MTRTLMLVSVFAVIFGTCTFAAQPIEFDKSQLVGADIPKQYRPYYSREALGRHQTGSGVFILHVDSKTGEVSSISVQKSTGFYLLDTAARTSCIHWRFKPYTVTEVRVPMTFSMRGAVIEEWGPHGAR